MTRNEYQEKAMTTCMPSSNNLAYMLYGLLGEVGELVEKIGKATKDANMNTIAPMPLFCGVVAKNIRKESGDETASACSSINTFTEQLSANKEIQK